MAEKNNRIDENIHWYKDAIIYELHIKAFRDGNCDGIGDFKGLIEKIPYLADLGVTAIWLLPFYPSPLRDDGYDIADYYNINPSYGDIKQFKAFLKEAHKRGLRVITELVINHTSDQHPWFQRARKAPKGPTIEIIMYGLMILQSSKTQGSFSRITKPPTGPGTRLRNSTSGIVSSIISPT